MGDRIGQQLGNYQLVRLLGEGGFAEVYLGEHIHLGTQAAIKVLHTQLGSEDASEFHTEAKTIAHLVHPHIVRVLDFGIEGKMPFLVMDYAPNGTLRQRHVKGTVLPPAMVASYIKQVAEGLQYAHNEKLIHRDIKPENMLLGRNDEILLSDFGIALVAQSSRYQNTQDVVGTVAYMSPEQIQGKPRPSSDQYSLAIVAYEWLSGDRPFHGSFTELCTQHMFATPAPIHAKIPTISAELDQVLQTALAKDPHLRFSSVQAFANAFEQAAQAKTSQPNIQSHPLNPPTPVPPMQYVPPPTQYVPPIAPPPPAYYSGYGSYPGVPNANVNYVYGGYAPGYYPAGTKVRPQPKITEKPWSFGKQEIIATSIGIAVCIGLGILLGLDFNADPSGNHTVAILVVLAAFTLVTPQFFGAVFGPWTGLLTGGVGMFSGLIVLLNIVELRYTGRMLTSYDFSSGYRDIWPYNLGLAIVGLISGFAMFKINSRFNIARTLGFGILGAIGGVTVATLLFTLVAASLDAYFIKSSGFWNYFIIPTLVITVAYIVISLILLPLLRLIHYALFVRGRQQV